MKRNSMEQAKWIVGPKAKLDGGRFPEYNKRRSLFYLEVLKWQLNNREIKRFHYKTRAKNIVQPRVFCGKVIASIVIQEADIVVWACQLREDKLYFENERSKKYA